MTVRIGTSKVYEIESKVDLEANMVDVLFPDGETELGKEYSSAVQELKALGAEKLGQFMMESLDGLEDSGWEGFSGLDAVGITHLLTDLAIASRHIK